jgi:tetratricopeptide (TPR) repeat protein
MSDPDPVLAARAALGAQLAALRKQAGHTQHSLVRLLNGYSRSALANTETGYQHARRDFWEQCDTILATGGVLARGFDDIEALMRAHQELAAQRAQAEREDRIRRQHAAAKAEARSLLERMAGQQADDSSDAALVPAVPLDLPSPPPGVNGRPADQSYVEWARASAQRLVVMDGQHGGDDIAALAVRTFRSVHHRLGTGAYQPKIERDLQAAAAELAEVAGWLLYDANRHAAARQLNQEALFYTRLAGDLHMEQLILQNMSAQAVRLRRPTEGLTLAKQLLDTEPSSARLRALFRIREARALAERGQAREALTSFAQARSLFLDGVPDGDPPWVWWITNGLLDNQESNVNASLSIWGRAVELSRSALEATPATQPRDRYINSVDLLIAMVRARAWEDAESLLPDILSYAYTVGSGRTAALLLEIIPMVASTTTPELREGARYLREVLEREG